MGFAIESLSADDGGVKQENGENRHQNSPGSVDLASQDTEESEEEEEARLKIHSGTTFFFLRENSIAWKQFFTDLYSL